MRAKLRVPARRCRFRGWVSGARSVVRCSVPPRALPWPAFPDQSGSHVIRRGTCLQDESACQNVRELVRISKPSVVDHFSVNRPLLYLLPLTVAVRPATVAVRPAKAPRSHQSEDSYTLWSLQVSK